MYFVYAVSYITKLLNWKQITTYFGKCPTAISCFLYHKVTKLKANHNSLLYLACKAMAVSYITKLLNWKQITTNAQHVCTTHRCFLYHKVTKLKANHNLNGKTHNLAVAVSYITKLLNWKQITTQKRCLIKLLMLFPISQSY